MRRAVVGSVALAALSFLLAPPAPSYDPWAWLLWGREVATGELNTLEGPAFKPLPVAACALLFPFGSAAPWLWVLVARSAAALAVFLAFRLGRRLSGGSVGAGVLAALGVVLCEHYLLYAASGVTEGALLALALGGAEAWRAGRPRLSLACAVACALLRVETWPFLVAAAVVAWRRRPQDRALILGAALFVPTAWFVPELVGSGDLLRSAARARIPNPGQPALAAVPALASLRAAVVVPLWPLWAGVGLLAWRARGQGHRTTGAALVPAGVGLVWMAIVALMAQAGFSGEPRYTLPGAALVAVSGAVGLATNVPGMPRRRTGFAVAAGVVVLAAAPRAFDLPDVRAQQAHQWELHTDLAVAVGQVGGRESVLTCGQPYVGPVRGPLLAYHLDVGKYAVEPDRPPQAPAVVFRSAFTAREAPMPTVPPGFHHVAEAGPWDVFASC